MAMEAVDAELVNAAEENLVEGDGLGASVDKENEVSGTGSDALLDNGVVKDPLKSEVLSSSGPGEEERSGVVNGTKARNPSKNVKATKEQNSRNGEAGVTRNQKVALSKSVSFPAKVAPVSNLRKSTTFMKHKNTDAKTSGQNGSEVVAAVANGGPPAKKNNFFAVLNARRSLQMKPGSMDATVNNTSEAAPSNGDTIKPLRVTLPVKNDDDANSTTSSTTPRTMAQRKSMGSGFSFRLDERAEKRKEFFMKLEEKVHAKEVEKTNMQAKSKENQEAEIKQLRKSLTFKATPMPNFYQEPGPPKVELKKIPPTRARSPKLGRHKSTVSSAESSLEGNIVSRSSHPGPDQNELNEGAANSKVCSSALKKPNQKLLSKLPSQKSTSAKPETKSAVPKLKAVKPKQKIDKAAAVNSKPDCSPKTVDTVETDSLKNPANAPDTAPEVEINSFESSTAANAVLPNLSDTGITPNEVLVES